MDPIYWSIVLLMAGFAFIVLEVLLPSAGILGVTAGCFLVAGVVMGFLQSYFAGAIVFFLTTLAFPLYFAGLVKLWPHTPIGRRVLLKDLSSDDVLPNGPDQLRRTELVGQLGVAKSEMILSGQIIVDGEKFDAISTAFAIEAGTPIKVVSVKGNLIYVEAHDGEAISDSDVPDLSSPDRDVLDTPINELGIELGEL